MSNPFATGKQASSSNPFSGSYVPKYPSASATTPTLRQALMAMQLDKKQKGRDYSLGALLKRGAGDTGNAVLWAFDKIMRPQWAVTGAVSAGLDPKLGKDPGFAEVFGAAAHGAKAGFTGQSKKGFGEVLDEQGVLKGHARLRGVAGFYGDVAYDPLMLASTAAAPVTGGGSLAAYTALKTGAKAAGKEVAEATLRTAAKKAAHDAGRQVLDGKVTDDAIEVLTKAGPDFQARLGLAKTIKAGEKAHPSEMLADNKWFQEKAIAQEIAYAEEKRVTKRAVQLRYGTQKYALKTPTTIRGRQIAPTVPKMANTAARKIPVLSKIVDATGKRFVPGFRREELHAAEMARLKIAQVNNTHQAARIADIMQGRSLRGTGVGIHEANPALNKAVQDLAKEDQLHAMALFESPIKAKNGRVARAVIKKDGEYVLNEKYISLLRAKYDAGDIVHGISEAQAEFIRRFHEATQFLYNRDQAYGVKYRGIHRGEKGQLYVPHRFMTDGNPINMNQMEQNIFTDAGFQHLRSKTDITLRKLDELVQKGKLPKAVETDPYKLLTATSRARAEKQADQIMIHSLENYIGIPTRIVNPAQMEKATARLSKANKALVKAETTAAKAEQALGDAKIEARTSIEKEIDAKIEEIQKKIRSVRHSKPANKRVGAAYDAINETWAKKIKQLDTTIKSNLTRAQREATRLRKEADAAEAQAERAIQGKEVKVKPITIKQKVDPAKAKALEHARIQHEDAVDLAARLPEDPPVHNARILGELEQMDHTSQAVDDFREIKRADYEKGPDGTEEYQGDKADAWENVKEEHQAHLEDTAQELDAAKKDATEITVKPKVTTKVVVNKGWVTRSTKLAHAKMEAADAAEAKLATLPTEIDDNALNALTNERNDAIEKAAKMADINQRRTKKATIMVMENRIGLLKVEKARKLGQLDKPASRESIAAYGPTRRTKIEAFEARAAARKEVKLAENAGDAAAKGKKNPAYSAQTHRKLGKSTDEWGNDYAYPPEVADSMERLRKIVSGDEKTIDDFAKGYGKLMASWKLLVTVVNPGYRIRNTMTDFWNMWVAGVPAHMISKVGFIGRNSALGVMRRAKKGDMDAIHTILEAATHGVLSGLFAGDVAAVAKMMKYSASKKALIKDKHFIRLYTKVMTDVNKNAENWGRLTHYLYRKDWQQMSGADAALKVKLAHFDYEDLTPFEQKIMKRVFPFYTWTRKNIPYQVRMLVQQPGRYSAFPKMAQEAGYASGDASSDPSVPSYMGDNFYMRIGKNRFLNPQFGPGDLAPLQGPGQAFDRVKGMVTPAAKIPAEIIMNKSMFTGQPISGNKHPRDPVTPLGAALLGLIPGNPANVGQTSRQGVSGPGANPWAAYALGQTPITRLLGVTGGGIKKKTAGTNSLLSYLGGISTSTVDQEAQRGYMTQDAYQEADRVIQGLRDAGLLPQPKQRKLSKKEQAIQTQVFGP
jgi:hypothetical protein